MKSDFRLVFFRLKVIQLIPKSIGVAAKVFSEALKDKKVQDRETLKAALEKTNLDLGGFKV